MVVLSNTEQPGVPLNSYVTDIKSPITGEYRCVEQLVAALVSVIVVVPLILTPQNVQSDDNVY